MGQLEDFRASLKRKDSAVSSEGENPVKNVSKAKQEKMKRRTLGVSGELHLELKALSVWRIKSHPKASPGITDTIQEMIRVYYKKYPETKEFVEELERIAFENNLSLNQLVIQCLKYSIDNLDTSDDEKE